MVEDVARMVAFPEGGKAGEGSEREDVVTKRAT
jgi:hypothetical protein